MAERRAAGRRDGAAAAKVAGILTEMASEGERVGHVVVGIGLNVNGPRFPPELADARDLAGGWRWARAFDRASVLAAVLAALEPLYDDFEPRGAGGGGARRWKRTRALGARCRVTRLGAGATLEGRRAGHRPRRRPAVCGR